MTPKFAVGQIVRFSDFVISQAPKYTAKRYRIVALACSGWEIGHAEWYGQYAIENIETGDDAITYESSLVHA